jgi:hypothetical protein
MSQRDGTFSGPVAADGFFAIVPRNAAGEAGPRRLIGVTVVPDAPPTVRIVAPGHDLLVPDGNRTIAVEIEADDDLGLADVALRYTRVRGFGEQFTFTDGDLPVQITRASDRRWTARARWPLAGLALEPGDLLIYRGFAADRRPGAPDVESDAFIIEIAAPGALPAGGFAIDDQMDRYAISQQMVIVKTERLLAARRTMTTDEFEREAHAIAADQRQVRAEFVFMMGGHLADHGLDPDDLGEEHEAAGEDDLAAGRLFNQGRADLMRAIRSMSRAAELLAEPDVAGALPVEQQALESLQRAFSRARYILRALNERERLDPERRLTGELTGLARPSRPAADGPAPPHVAALRGILADLAGLAADPSRDAPDGPLRATRLADRVLRVTPLPDPLRDAAAALASAAGSLSSADPASADAAFDRAATLLSRELRVALPEQPAQSPHAALSRLAGALADALRGGGRP